MTKSNRTPCRDLSDANASANVLTMATGLPLIVSAPFTPQPRTSTPPFASHPLRIPCASFGKVESIVTQWPLAESWPTKTCAAFPPPHTRTRRSLEGAEDVEGVVEDIPRRRDTGRAPRYCRVFWGVVAFWHGTSRQPMGCVRSKKHINLWPFLLFEPGTPDSARTRSAQALAGCGDGISPRADARGLHRDRHPEAYPWQVGCFLRLGINFKNLSSGSKLSPRPTQ